MVVVMVLAMEKYERSVKAASASKSMYVGDLRAYLQ